MHRVSSDVTGRAGPLTSYRCSKGCDPNASVKQSSGVVADLRQAAQQWSDGNPSFDASHVMRDAADEIERLRAQRNALIKMIREGSAQIFLPMVLASIKEVEDYEA